MWGWSHSEAHRDFWIWSTVWGPWQDLPLAGPWFPYPNNEEEYTAGVYGSKWTILAFKALVCFFFLLPSGLPRGLTFYHQAKLGERERLGVLERNKEQDFSDTSSQER